MKDKPLPRSVEIQIEMAEEGVANRGVTPQSKNNIRIVLNKVAKGVNRDL